jgi:heptosyltransferase-3
MRGLAGWLSNLSFKGSRFAAEESRSHACSTGGFSGAGAKWSIWSRDGETDAARSPKGERDKSSLFGALPWSRRRSSGNVERIVIYRLGSLGDTVIALPCLHKIAKAFPHAERLVLTNIPVSAKAAPLASILANSGLVHGYVTYPLGVRSLHALWDLAWQLRRLRASTLVYLTLDRGGRTLSRDLLFFRLCGFKRIIGAPVTQDLSNHRFEPETGTFEYEASRLSRTLFELGPIDLDDPASWDLRLTAEEQAAGAKTIAPFAGRPFIAINMGGKWVENQWGSDNWRALLDELATTHGSFGILAIGGPEDAAAVGPATANWPGAVVNSCGTLAPRETAAALEKASLFVGHDSGPMHLAAACGVRCVGLFGRLQPRIWHPYGSGHRPLHKPNQGIMAIRVEEVANAVREISTESLVGRIAAQ